MSFFLETGIIARHANGIAEQDQRIAVSSGKRFWQGHRWLALVVLAVFSLGSELLLHLLLFLLARFRGIEDPVLGPSAQRCIRFDGNEISVVLRAMERRHHQVPAHKRERGGVAGVHDIDTSRPWRVHASEATYRAAPKPSQSESPSK
jgi:hypothetical protein